MPLVKDPDPVAKDAVQTAEADAKVKSTLNEPDEPVEEVVAPVETVRTEEPAAAVASTHTEIVQTNSGAVAVHRSGGQLAVMGQMEEEGHGGGFIDFTSFTNIVLKDGEFQLVGSTKSFSATAGFEGVVLQGRAKWAMRIGNDDDADVAFAYNKAEFSDLESEAGAKVAEWRSQGLKPELKEYAELLVQVEAIHAEECKDLEGDVVVVQVAPMSCGRWGGYKLKQRSRRGSNPDGYVTHFVRGEKVTAAKFPFYPWDFKFVRMN